MAGGFGFGNFVKPQATSVRPGDVPTFRDLNLQDKLLMLGATLRGDMQGAQSIPMLAAARAKQAELQGLDREWERYLTGEGVPTLKMGSRPAIEEAPEPQRDPTSSAAASVIASLGGDLDGVPMKHDRVQVDIPMLSVQRGEDRKGPPNLRDALPMLIKRRNAGLDIGKDVALLKEVGPDFDWVNGYRVDRRDPNAPTFIPTLDKGQSPDGKGGVVNLPGFVDSVAAVEGAKTGAQEQAKAKLDIITLNMPDGSTVQVPRDVAVQGLLQNLAGGAGSGLGRGQSPAEKKLEEDRAAAQADRESAAPKAFSGLEAQARATDLVLEKLNQILGERYDPEARAYVENGGGQISGWSAGLGDVLKNFPGSDARDLDATLDTIRSAVGFDKLQEMRANSPTGGALGAISDKENKLLQSVLGSLDQGQSPEQLTANLRRLRGELAAIRAERKGAYERQYNDASSTAGQKGRSSPNRNPSRADIEAEMRKRGLLQ